MHWMKRRKQLCLQYMDPVPPAKLYTRKEIVIMETSIDGFHTSFFTSTIQNLLFHLPTVRIIGNNHCVGTLRETFKRSRANQYVLCFRGYSERVVASFAHQIQSDYYGGN